VEDITGYSNRSSREQAIVAEFLDAFMVAYRSLNEGAIAPSHSLNLARRKKVQSNSAQVAESRPGAVPQN
jgi:hypothetical protein